MSDKYRIVSSIGAGNSSRVFLAEHRKLKAYRAVKCMKKTADEKCPQFLLEADLLKNLKHPGIPTIYDVEEDNENYYIIEERYNGTETGKTYAVDMMSGELFAAVYNRIGKFEFTIFY